MGSCNTGTNIITIYNPNIMTLERPHYSVHSQVALALQFWVGELQYNSWQNRVVRELGMHNNGAPMGRCSMGGIEHDHKYINFLT